MKKILEQLLERKNLTPEQMREVFESLMTGKLSDMQISAFLVGLNAKGITSQELAAAAGVMREKVTPVPIKVQAVDNCGTGGDGISTFNISTTAAIIAAGAGAYLAKHGNRSNTRKSGSAEVLATLGVNLDADPETVAKCIEQTHIGFCYAIKLHPAMKYAAPSRKALQIRTIFNLLGPLTNPAGVRRQVIGVPNEALTEKIAQALKLLDADRAMVVHGTDGLCDISISKPTKITELKDGNITSFDIAPEDFGITPAAIESILINTPEDSAKIITNILDGRPGPAREIAALNAASVLTTAGLVKSIKEGLTHAYEAIDSGEAKKTLEKLIKCSRSHL